MYVGNMKKIIAALIAVMIILSLSSCTKCKKMDGGIFYDEANLSDRAKYKNKTKV
jgi:hypothetical protein